MWGSDGPDANGFLPCRDRPDGILMMVVATIVTTVIINGITMAPLMRFLKLTDRTDERKFMLANALQCVHQESERFLKELHAQWGNLESGRDVDWDEVATCGVTEAVEGCGPCEDEARAAWYEVLNIERASYLRQFETGRLGSHAFRILEEFMAKLIADATKIEMLKAADRLDSLKAVAATAKSAAGGAAKSAAASAVVVVKAAAGAIREVQVKEVPSPNGEAGEALAVPSSPGKPEETPQSSGQIPRRATSRSSINRRRRSAMMEYAADQTHPIDKRISELYDAEFGDLIDKLKATDTPSKARVAYEVGIGYLQAMRDMEHQAGTDQSFAAVILDHDDNKKRMNKMMDLVARRFPKVIATLRKNFATQLLLHRQRHIIDELKEEGCLTDLDAAPLIESVNEKLKHLYIQRYRNKQWAAVKHLKKQLMKLSTFGQAHKDGSRPVELSEVQVESTTSASATSTDPAAKA